jgi:flagellar basal-body rod protein FlgC
MIPILTGIESTSAALTAGRIRMEVVSQNIANASTSRSLSGGPYRRQHVVFETVLNASQNPHAALGAKPESLQVARIQSDLRPPRLVHQPGHPDADAQGMVALPNINIHEEMVDLISASRAFEANLAVLKTGRSMAIQTLSIGKR